MLHIFLRFPRHTFAIKILFSSASLSFHEEAYLPREIFEDETNTFTSINIYSNDTKLKVLWRQRFDYQMIWSLIN